MNFRGYTTLMSPEAMKLPYLETLLSWSRVCETISICYSKFPKMDVKVPEGAVTPWEDDNSLEILQQFDRDVLGNKLNILVGHEWDPNEPLEDGITKQLARSHAFKLMGKDPLGWAFQFDADEILRDGDELRILQECCDDNDKPMDKRKPFVLTGILEFFGSADAVRFGFGNWTKIRGTRNIPEIFHGLPLRMGNAAVRTKNPRTGKIVSKENRDDGAGFISALDFTRPDYNAGLWLFNPQVLNMMGQVRVQVPDEQRSQIWPQVTTAMLQDIGQGGVWLYHTSWIDIARKWRMGWHFDNFFSVLAGRQDTYIEKADAKGEFTHVGCPPADKLEEALRVELNRPEIQPLKGTIPTPSVFETVATWRNKVGL